MGTIGEVPRSCQENPCVTGTGRIAPEGPSLLRSAAAARPRSSADDEVYSAREHDPTFWRSDSFHEHDGRDGMPALAGDLPGACRAPHVEWRGQFLAEPRRGHRPSGAPVGDGPGR